MNASQTPATQSDPEPAKGETITPQRKAFLGALAEEIFVISTASWQMRQRQKTAGRFDLSETEYLTLDLVVREGTMTVGQLQKHIGVLPAQMSRIIRSLEGNFERPMIQCAINPKDKRKVDVSATEFGRQAHREFRDARLSQTIEVLSQVSDKDLDDFMRVIRLFRQGLAQSATS